MEYRHVNGRVYSRYAFTPPVVNSDLANTHGIEAPSSVPLDQGSSVKLRIVLHHLSKRMTCHAVVDHVTEDEATGTYSVAFGQLSLSDDEFKVLLDNCVEKGDLAIEFGESVRHGGVDTSPVTEGHEGGEITRVKAITLPVGLIEAIDAKRGDVPFSEFVTQALWKTTKD
jgi:hypothetical protein